MSVLACCDVASAGRVLRLIIRSAFTARISTQQNVAACVVTAGTLELRMIQQ